MDKVTRERYGVVLIAASVLCLLILFDRPVYAQAQTATPSPSPSCPNSASPGVLKLVSSNINPDNFVLARKHFYLSSTPFNLATNLAANHLDLSEAPSISGYYAKQGASQELIAWLKKNHCETVYCRELTLKEVTCEGEPKECVPEFKDSFNEALKELTDKDRARKWITMYGPLSSPKFRTGFSEARSEWLKRAVEAVQNGQPNGSKIIEGMTDRNGAVGFYDLCPGEYFVSSLAPIESGEKVLYWESAADKPIVVEELTVTSATLAFPPTTGQPRKNFLVGKPFSWPAAGQKPSGQ